MGPDSTPAHTMHCFALSLRVEASRIADTGPPPSRASYQLRMQCSPTISSLSGAESLHSGAASCNHAIFLRIIRKMFW